MNGYIVDTNIISEVIKAKPDPNAIAWLDRNSRMLYLTSITLEELRFGALMMPMGKKRKALEEWIDSLSVVYSQKILSFDAPSAEICASFHEKAVSLGRTPSIEDLMIASIAQKEGFCVATRNMKDFEYLDIDLVNPFEA